VQQRFDQAISFLKDIARPGSLDQPSTALQPQFRWGSDDLKERSPSPLSDKNIEGFV